MRSVLEEKLSEIEKNSPITNDKELVAALDYIIENSEVKTESDIELINEAVEMKLMLEGEDKKALESHASSWAIKYLESVDNKKNVKAKKGRIKWIIPAAAILSVLLVTVVGSTAFEHGFMSITKQVYTEIMKNVFYKDGDLEINATKNFEKYNSYDEMAAERDIDNLLWISNPEYNIDGEISFMDLGEYIVIDCRINMDSGDSSYEIKYPDEAIGLNGKETVRIGNYDVYTVTYDGVYQGEFRYDGGYYRVASPTYEDMKYIIENLG